MRARDVMASSVITVRPDTSVSDVAAILLNNRISAVPVLDADGALVGIVSEGDLVRRVEAGTERHPSRWLALFSDRGLLAREYLKSHAARAADVMTTPVVTAAPDTPLDQLADLLERHRIKRVPIAQDGRLVGIVSRADLMRVLAGCRKQTQPAAPIEDTELRRRILEDMKSQPWACAASINVVVHEGTVELWGGVESNDERRALRVAIEQIPGVHGVIDHLAVERWRYGL